MHLIIHINLGIAASNKLCHMRWSKEIYLNK